MFKIELDGLEQLQQALRELPEQLFQQRVKAIEDLECPVHFAKPGISWQGTMDVKLTCCCEEFRNQLRESISG
jgi:hypothetical protein